MPPPPAEPVDFQVRGTVGVVNGSERYPSMRFLWRQQGPGFTIDLWGPLGQGRLRLIGDGQHVAVVDSDGEVLTQGSQADVMRAHLGWSLPLEVLPDWLLGAPSAGVASQHEEYDEAGHLVAFEQLHWKVSYARQRQVEGSTGVRWLPRNITARKGDYRVRLVISDWQI